MAIVTFITHPEVVIDPAVPVTAWPLSPVGRQRMRALSRQPWVASIRSVFSSTERKSVDSAAILAEVLGLRPVALAELGENDRSATGYLAKAEFETVADEFFAKPDVSVRGWERAVDAQRRIVDAIDSVLAQAREGDVAIVAHGGVGALLLCHLKGIAISRAEDQPGAGGGCLFRFDRADRRLISGWQRMDA